MVVDKPQYAEKSVIDDISTKVFSAYLKVSDLVLKGAVEKLNECT